MCLKRLHRVEWSEEEWNENPYVSRSRSRVRYFVFFLCISIISVFSVFSFLNFVFFFSLSLSFICYIQAGTYRFNGAHVRQSISVSRLSVNKRVRAIESAKKKYCRAQNKKKIILAIHLNWNGIQMWLEPAPRTNRQLNKLITCRWRRICVAKLNF